MSLWSCTSCSKTFARKGDLTRHELLHTGVKPHICETCGKGFAQFSGLKTHRNVHSKAKPYLCGIGTCRKAFGDPSSCTRHRKETHRREAAYKCFVEDCGTKIKRRSTFAAHLRKHGIDTRMLDFDTMTLTSGTRGIPLAVQLASPSSHVEDNLQRKVESRSPSPLVHSEGPSSICLDNRGGAIPSSDKNELSDQDPILFQQASWYPLGDGAYSLVPRVLPLDHSMRADPSNSPIPSYELYRYPSANNDPFSLDEVFSTAVDCQFFDASPLQIPVFEPFLDVGSDVSRSSSASPLSTFSLLYSSDSFEDMGLSSLTTNAPQELLLYSTI